MLLLAAAGTAAGAQAQTRATRTEDSAAFVREFPLALIYRGVGLFQVGDYQGAAEAWQDYLQQAGADTASVHQLIHEALVKAHPMMLVYEGLALVQNGDTIGGIQSWERHLTPVPDADDEVGVRELTERVFFQQCPQALLYRGVFLYQAQEYQAAVGSWERYLAVAPDQDRADVRGLIAMARRELEADDIVLH